MFDLQDELMDLNADLLSHPSLGRHVPAMAKSMIGLLRSSTKFTMSLLMSTEISLRTRDLAGLLHA